jgi:HAD superfamily hydrolase (TIGR01509 family)
VPLLTHLSDPKDPFIIPDLVRALVIDFDGTIMNIRYSEGARQAAYRAAIKQVVKKECNLDLTHEQVKECHKAGVNNPETKMAELIAQKIEEIHKLQIPSAKLFAAWLQQCDDRLELHESRFRRPVSSALVPGIKALINAAYARGIPVSVCTAGHNNFVEPLLSKTEITSNLCTEANVFINRHDIPSKPAGDSYLLAATFLQVAPSQMLVLEDSATGALAALRAGARVLLQPSGDREQTIRALLSRVKRDHPDWLEQRAGDVTVLAKDRGWLQVQFPNLATPEA